MVITQSNEIELFEERFWGSMMAESKKVSIAQEDRISKIFNGKRTSQSGGGKWRKGDVLAEDFLVECKTTLTAKNSYSVSKSVLEKADEERRQMGKQFYALAFTFGGDEDFFVLNAKAMRYLLECTKQAQ